MDYHRQQPRKAEAPTGRDCKFCHDSDPNFDSRRYLDKLIRSNLGDTATAHITEDGYVLHRILEIAKRSGGNSRPPGSAAA